MSLFAFCLRVGRAPVGVALLCAIGGCNQHEIQICIGVLPGALFGFLFSALNFFVGPQPPWLDVQSWRCCPQCILGFGIHFV